MTTSQHESAAIVPVAQRPGYRVLRDNGGKSGRKPHNDTELRSHRVLLDNGGDSSAIPRPHNELQRHRVLLDNAPCRRLPPPPSLGQTLPLPQGRVPLAPLLLGIGMRATPTAVLHRAAAEVPGMPPQPGRLGGRLALPLAAISSARELPGPHPRIRGEPPPAETARPPRSL